MPTLPEPSRLGGLPRFALLALLVAVAAGCSSGPYEDFDQPRTVRVAPDGRLVVADLGSGDNDGRVVAIDADDQTEVLLDDLPSILPSGQQHSELAGPSGADVAPDGTACAAVGWARESGAGFTTLQCSDGLVVDLQEFEERENPDGLKAETNPYDVVSDRDGGWYVTDAAANALLHVSSEGEVRAVAAFPALPTDEADRADRGVQGVPTGVHVDDDGVLWVALFGGAPFGDGTGAVVRVDPEQVGGGEEPGADGGEPVGIGADGVEVVAEAPYPIAASPTADGRLAVLSRGTTYDDERGGQLLLLPMDAGPGAEPEVVASGLRAPTGFARLPDGTFVVAEEPEGRLLRVEPGER